MAGMVWGWGWGEEVGGGAGGRPALRWSHFSLPCTLGEPDSLPSSPSGKPHLGLQVLSDLQGMGDLDPLGGAGSQCVSRERLVGFTSREPRVMPSGEMANQASTRAFAGAPPVGELMVYTRGGRGRGVHPKLLCGSAWHPGLAHRRHQGTMACGRF